MIMMKRRGTTKTNNEEDDNAIDVNVSAERGDPRLSISASKRQHNSTTPSLGCAKYN